MTDMNKVKITVLKRQDPKEIYDVYPIDERDIRPDMLVPCGVYEDNQEFYLEDCRRMPEGFCPSAWQTIYPNVRTLGFGGDMPYFNVKGVAICCCSDGMRPVIFKIERI